MVIFLSLIILIFLGGIMIKIYGLKVSNFSSMVRFALIEKNIEFEWIETFPFSMSGDKNILDKSTNGAVPILEYNGQFISETLAIMSFLEKKFPDIKLISDDPLEHAKTIEIIKILEIYIETSARNFYPFVYFGGKKKEDNLDQIKETIDRGLSILEKKASLTPFMVSKFSYADIFASMSLFPAKAVCEKIYSWNIFDDYKKLGESVEDINSRDAAKIIYADIEEGMEQIQKSMNK